MSMVHKAIGNDVESPQSVLLMAVVGGKASFGRGIDGSRSNVENERP